MAGDLRVRDRELHVGEQATGTPVADVGLRLDVRLSGRRADDVEAKLLAEPLQLRRRHERILTVKAVRIHEDGGPDVLRYEDVPDPEPGEGEVLIRIKAASLNHLDLWVRMGLPSVPKPRILGADGAGVIEALGAGVETFAIGDRVVINPGIEHGATISVVGEHCDGTHCELIAIAADQVFPLDDALSFEQGAAFPLVFETAYRMLVTKAALQPGEWVLIWGIGGGVATAAFELSGRWAPVPSSPPAATTSSSRRAPGAPTSRSTTTMVTSSPPSRRRPAKAWTSSSRRSARRRGRGRWRPSRPQDA